MQNRATHSIEGTAGRANNAPAVAAARFRLPHPVAANDDIGPALTMDCLDAFLPLSRMLALEAEREAPE